MTGGLRRLGLLSLFLTHALLLAAPRPASQADATAEREILVMLRLPPPHYRPNADYGGDYGDRLARGARRHLAARIARSHGLNLVDGWPMPLIGLDCFVMAVPDGQSVEAAAAIVARDPGVDSAQPLHLYHAQAAGRTAGDPLLPTQPAARLWHLADLHRIATGRGVSVAVIDSAIETRHPDLAGQVAVAKDFAPTRSVKAEDHGTAVGGIIAARADNGIGIAGVAPGARLMGLRACRQLAAKTVCDSLSLAKALHFAVTHNAHVINLSLSGPQDPLLGKLLDVALARGASVVAAFDPTLPSGGFPASHPGVIAVVDRESASPRPGVYSAPGQDIPATAPGGRWYLVDGSSYAAAHVSGLVALLREHRSPAGPVLLVSSRTKGGEIDACATLLHLSALCDCACSVAQQVTASAHR
jgi:subtilisin family serine protease